MNNFKEIALESKAWPVVEARKILDRVTKSSNKSINLQTGYGPSGLPHIGTFGEVARTTMIYNALKNLTDESYWNWSSVQGKSASDANLDLFMEPGRNSSVGLKYEF